MLWTGPTKSSAEESVSTVAAAAGPAIAIADDESSSRGIMLDGSSCVALSTQSGVDARDQSGVEGKRGLLAGQRESERASGAAEQCQ